MCVCCQRRSCDNNFGFRSVCVCVCEEMDHWSSVRLYFSAERSRSSLLTSQPTSKSQRPSCSSTTDILDIPICVDFVHKSAALRKSSTAKLNAHVHRRKVFVSSVRELNWSYSKYFSDFHPIKVAFFRLVDFGLRVQCVFWFHALVRMSICLLWSCLLR